MQERTNEGIRAQRACKQMPINKTAAAAPLKHPAETFGGWVVSALVLGYQGMASIESILIPWCSSSSSKARMC
jgi:hypothetical protein